MNIVTRKKFISIKTFNCLINQIELGLIPYLTSIRWRIFYLQIKFGIYNVMVAFQIHWWMNEASTIKFGWFVKIRSIQLQEFSRTWVGSAITCFISYSEVRDSNWVPSLNDWSLMNHVFDFTLKSPNSNIKWGLRLIISAKRFP